MAHLRAKLHVALQQRDSAQREVEELRSRAQRAELALAKETRQRKDLLRRVAELETRVKELSGIPSPEINISG